MSASRRKGTAAESALVGYLQAHGWPFAERRALAGGKDKGDVVGTVGICWEQKSAVRICIPEWMRETETERVNAAADFGVLVIKPRGVGETRVGQWAALLPLEAVVELLHRAGYGDAPIAEASA